MRKKSNLQRETFHITVVNKFDSRDTFHFIAKGRTLSEASEHVLPFFDKNLYKLGNCRVVYSNEVVCLFSYQSMNPDYYAL